MIPIAPYNHVGDVERAREGDREAFSRLYEKFRIPVAAFIRYRTSLEAEDDLLQETFALAFRHIRSLRDPERFGPWLMQIARNCCRKWLAAHAQRRQAEYGEADCAFLIEYAAEQPSLAPMDAADLRVDVAALLRMLPEKYALPLQMHYLQGVPLADIAEVLDEPITTVKWRIHRALELCRLQMLKAHHNSVEGTRT